MRANSRRGRASSWPKDADSFAKPPRCWCVGEGAAHALRIGEKSDHTLEEVGKAFFEVTRERIRQIEAKALRKLQHPARSSGLKSFVEN